MSVRELVWKLQAEGAGEFADSVSKADEGVDALKSNIEGSTGAVSGFLKETGGKLKTVGGGMAKAGAGMTAATLPLAMKLKQGVNDARELDTAVRQVTTLADSDILPVDTIRSSIKQISNEAGIAQTEVANAMYEALSSGISTEDVTAFTEQGLMLMRAGFTDLPTVIDATTTALNAYGENALAVTDIQDIFVKTQDLGKITVDELGKNIGRVVPVAAAAGVNIDQLGAAYSMLTARGQNAQIATTNLNGLLTELSTNGSKADEALKNQVGKSFQELTQEGYNLGDVLGILNTEATETGVALGDMFGNISARGAANTLFSEGAEGFGSILDEMQNAQGTVSANYEKMMGDQLAFEQSTQQLKNAFIDLGIAVTPVITTVMEKIGELAMKFQELSPHQQKLVGIFSLIAIAAGPLLMVVGGIIAGIGALGIVIAGITAPIAIGIGAFALLMAAGAALAFHWETVKTKASELGNAIRTKLQAAATAVSSGFNSMKATVNSALESIKQKWESVKAFFAKPIKGVVNIAGGIGAKIKGMLPSHATGLGYVPYDNYTANLHQGEMVLTKQASDQFRGIGGTENGLPMNGSLKSASNTTNTSNNNTTNSNVFNIYVNGSESVATDVRKEIEGIFRNLQLQRA